VAGARWVQNEILQKNPAAKLQVYAIWFNMYPGDAREQWSANLLTDPRVVHFWDEQKIVGTWFGKQHPEYLKGGQSAVWDAFILYGAEARWQESISHRLSMGRTIVAKREDLRQSLLPLLKQ
jgi:hypothetical protein